MAIFHQAKDGRLEHCEKKFFLYGNGAHTRVIYGCLHKLPGLAGFVVDDAFVAQRPSIDEYPVVPVSRVREVFPPEEYVALVALAFRDFNGLREKKSLELEALGYTLVSFVDESVRLPRNFEIAPNCILIEHVALNEGAAVKRGTFVSSGAKVGHDSLLGEYSWVGSGAALAGGVQVGDYSILGLNCSLKQNVRLAHHSLVLPNTFVNAHTKPYEVVAVPAGKTIKIDSRMAMKFAYIDSLASGD